MPLAPTQVTVATGTSYTTSVSNVLIKMNSATTGAKTVNIPANAGSLTTIVIYDLFGNAGTYPITPVAQSPGGILGEGSASVYTDGGSVTLLDATEGWLPI